MHIVHQEQDARHTAYVVADGGLMAMVLVTHASGQMQSEAVGGASDADCELFAAEAVAWLQARRRRHLTACAAA